MKKLLALSLVLAMAVAASAGPVRFMVRGEAPGIIEVTGSDMIWIDVFSDIPARGIDFDGVGDNYDIGPLGDAPGAYEYNADLTENWAPTPYHGDTGVLWLSVSYGMSPRTIQRKASSGAFCITCPKAWTPRRTSRSCLRWVVLGV